MNDKGSLERQLEELAAAGTADFAGRELRALSPDTLRKHLLRTLNGTMMPRVLSLKSDTGRAVVAEIAHGRVARIVSADLTQPPTGLPELLGQPLATSEDHVVQHIAAVFADLVDGASALRIKVEGTGPASDPTHAGPSARAIAEIWGIEIDPAALPEPGAIFDDFLAAVQGHSIAWLMEGPTAEESGGAGDENALDDLAAFAEAWSASDYASAFSVGLPDGERWGLICLHRAPTAEEVTVVAHYSGPRLFLAVPKDQLDFVTDAWRRAVSA